MLTENPIASKNILYEWRENKDILRWRKTNRICYQQTHPKTIGSTLKWKEMIKEETLECQEGRTREAKPWETKIDFSSIEFSNFWLIVEAQIITLSDIVLNVPTGNM